MSNCEESFLQASKHYYFISSVGRRGPVGLFVNNNSITAPRVEGSNLGPSSFFYFVNVPAANCSEERQVRSPARRKAGAATIEKRKTGRRFRNGFTRMVRFVSKTIKWLTPSKERHGEKY